MINSIGQTRERRKINFLAPAIRALCVYHQSEGRSRDNSNTVIITITTPQEEAEDDQNCNRNSIDSNN